MTEKEIYKKNISADMVALSTITATAPAAYRIAQFYKNKEIPTVIGGPHVTFCPEEALRYTDYCICGEGENALPQLISALNLNTSLKKVPGLVWSTHGRIYRNPIAAPICDLNKLPFPELSLIEYGQNSYRRNPFKKKIIPIQTSRGCPFDCTFCSVTGMFGKKYRYRSTENIINELQQYNPQKHYIFFYDDNFSAHRKRTKELLLKMIKLKLKFKWSTQVRADIAKDQELLKLMKQAGCRVLYIGFESCNQDALTEMHKSQTVSDMIWSIKEIKKQNIYIHGMFVFGFDADTLKTVNSTINFAISQSIDSAQFLILTPLPGTEFYANLIRDKRIIDFNWAHYDAHHVKFKPKNFNGLDLQNAQIKAHDKFYSPLNLIKKLFTGKIVSFFVGLYANNLNKKWKKTVQVYLWYLNSVVRA